MCPTCCVHTNIWLKQFTFRPLVIGNAPGAPVRPSSIFFVLVCLFSPPPASSINSQVRRKKVLHVIPHKSHVHTHLLSETFCRLQSIADFHAPGACVRPSPPSPFLEALRFLFPPDRPEDSSARLAVHNNSHVSCSPCSGGNNMRYCTTDYGYIRAMATFKLIAHISNPTNSNTTVHTWLGRGLCCRGAFCRLA
jgi:hypothetical protein